MSRNLNNIDKIFSRSERPNPDALVDYVNDDATEEEARQIEEAMADDPFLSDAVEGIEALGANDFTDLLAELNADIDTQLDQPEGKEIQFTPEVAPAAAPVSKSSSGFRMMAIAAAVVLLAVVGYFVVPFGGAGSMAMDHYQGYDLGTSVRVDGVQQSEFDKAGSLFKAGKFKEAAHLFEKISDPSAKLMAGHSYFNLKDYDQAATFFNEAITMDEDAREDAEYNLALCFIAQKKKKEARQILKKIAGDEFHPYHMQADGVLDDLGR